MEIKMDFDISLMRDVLKSTFGFDDFRDLQKPIVQSVMNKHDTLAILKTSGGKSLTYQAPAIYRGGTTLVISPLISLMKDQVDALVGKGVAAAYVNSGLALDEVQQRYATLARGGYALFYVSPERFQDQAFLQALVRSPLNMIAIDEAHCASQWGHNFRPSYARIGEYLDTLEVHLRRRVQRIALTATANSRAQQDIVTMLKLRAPEVHVQDFDRENLSYAVIMAKKSDRTVEILQTLEEHKGDCCIIYCVTVKEVERLYERLKGAGVDVNRYHGRLETEEKNEIQEQFIKGNIQCLIATSAFGMGVDKADVRLVIHAQMPGSLEAWYQEAGRAGRDGLPAKAILFYHDADKNIHRFFIGQASPESYRVEPVKEMIGRLLKNGPCHLDSRQIAMNCTQQLAVLNAALPEMGVRVMEITRNDVLATITLLTNQGEIEERDGLYALDNWQEDAEYIWVDDVKRHNWLKYNAMCSWCETNLCRRWQIMRYFDERKPHYHCGNCDNCEREALSIIQVNAVEKAVRPTTLIALANALNVVSDKHHKQWEHILLGTLPVSELTDEETQVSGRFAWHAVGDLRRWVKNLTDNEIIDDQRKLTAKGIEWVEGRLEIPIGKKPDREEAPASPVLPMQVIDNRVKMIRRWRKSVAYQEDINEITLLSEAQIQKIAKLEPLTFDALAGAGFSQDWVTQHAKTILTTIEKHERQSEYEL
jgi:ATP-dependent DNA helicase RecQ